MSLEIVDLYNELLSLDSGTRRYGNAWQRWLDDVAERYGLEPDMRSGVELGIGPNGFPSMRVVTADERLARRKQL